jgi:GPH family glycoside/pentoside/hexuronide:cation symporter
VSFLLWTPPVPGRESWINAVYVFTLVQLFFIFWSMLANPYMALLPEITTDLKERVNITTMQGVFLMLGTLIFGAMGPIKNKIGWIGIGAITGIITLISFAPTLLTIREKPSELSHVNSEKMRLGTIFTWARTTFKNRAFVFMLLALAFLWFSLNMVILIVPFWTQYVLGRSDADVVLLMGPFLVSNILFFFVFNFISKKAGKYAAFLITLGSAALTMSSLALVGLFKVGSLMLQSQVCMALIGIPVAGIMILPPAILSDVIDYDEKLTGQRREGIYVGVQAIFQKIAIGISIAAATVMMYMGGSSTPTVGGLKMISVSAGVFAFIAMLIFIRYPVREKDGKAFIKEG